MSETIVIVGPTATGKSRLGMALARRLDGEIVNADALQVYRGFDIGTAKPPAADRGEIPHHLIDILEPDERYSAGRFAELARPAIREIRSRGRTPIVVGGSGLYLRALLEGIGGIPAVEPEVEARLAVRLAEEGLSGLRRELEEKDPPTAARLAPGDTQRILRALGVALSTGRPLSEWIGIKAFGESRLEARRIGLTLDRPLLYDRIAVRVDRMLAAGWLEEVISLLDSGFNLSLPAFQAIGYRQLAGHLRGESSLEEAVEATVLATRRFAKRQMTWFRRERDIEWFSPRDFEELQRGVVDHIHTRPAHGK